DPRVRFQVALSLGEWDDPRIIAPLAKIAMAGAEDKWTRLAVASSLRSGPEDLIKTLLHDEAFARDPTPGRKALIKELAGLVRKEGVEERFRKLKSVFELPGENHKHWQMTFLDGLPPQTFFTLRALAFMGGDDLVPTVRKLEALVRECGKRALDAKLPVAERLECIRLMPH